ncbi:hypothetical protein HU200_002985 [Digitaria exilis]|uniref:Glycosyltransferase n=1 Tax=Digitaria exilis TaxID=1010633 RepID=A0A835FW51_9POAL|nr:hypothetical protein HU200_002985 [Digitaria exilis]
MSIRFSASRPKSQRQTQASTSPSPTPSPGTGACSHRLLSPDAEVAEGVLHIPYSDGYDEGFDPKVHDVGSFNARARAVGGETLSGIIERLAARGRPVTRVVYTFLVGWVLDVARTHGIPAAHYWIQPATVFAVYYHHFHCHGAVIASCANDPSRGGSVHLPGLPPLNSDALPSIVSITSPDQPLYPALSALRGLFSALGEHRPKVLVNTFEALELDALRAVPQLEVLAVGPVMLGSSSASNADLIKHGDAAEYMEWLDTKAARSVVYVSFGTMLPMSKHQELELTRGLEATNRAYLWVRVGAERSGDHDGTDGGSTGAQQEREQGMVVEWCDQALVLSHHAVGCFVTHCGWNSALESITHGVPIVAVPQWTDQPTVAWLVEERAGVGVRTAIGGEAVVGRDELRRCVEGVMGDGERAVEIRAQAKQWMEKAREAVSGGGTSEKNIRAFTSGL